ncbi:MAG: hypothetical protein ACKOEC_00235, partial [Acidimicrobiia bacterium]
MKQTRRDFINSTSAAMTGIAAAASIDLSASTQQAPAIVTSGSNSPDLVVTNAKVYTMDTRAPRAEAFAVTGGRFTAVGSTSDVRNLAGKSTQVFDAKGMTVVPGFIDCHVHADGEPLLYETLDGKAVDAEFVTMRSSLGKLRV